jgi:tryptophan synthase alpha chain
MKYRLMSHLVAFYPDRNGSLEVARALIDGGTTYLEVQFPFSDPIADGHYIQTACTQALKQGFKTEQGFTLIHDIATHGEVPIFLMCYANSIFFHGVGPFLDRCVDAGVRGIIVPDLPVDYDEGLYDLARKRQLSAVPVAAPTLKGRRLRSILALNPEYIYASLRKGITGAKTEIGRENIGFLESIRDAAGNPSPKILAGFGIATHDQVATLSSHVHASIVGSAFIREIMEGRGPLYGKVRKKVEDLSGH